MEVLYLGPEGSHSYVAAKAMYPLEDLVSLPTKDDIFYVLETYRNAVAVVPIKNTSWGPIDHSFENLFSRKYQIISEVYIKPTHNLLIHPNSDLSKIKKIFIDSQASLQCHKFLREHPEWEKISADSSSKAAKDISELSLIDTACIANSWAAKIYKLKTIKRNICDDTNNFTRYVSISQELFEFPSENSNKCSVVFELSNIPGTLAKAIQVLANKDYNITNIFSLPVPNKPWSLKLFIDFTFAGLLDLEMFENMTQNMKILGIYEQGSKVKEQ